VKTGVNFNALVTLAVKRQPALEPYVREVLGALTGRVQAALEAHREN
jgi:hypothetical protein